MKVRRSTGSRGSAAYGLGWECDKAEDRAGAGQCHGRGPGRERRADRGLDAAGRGARGTGRGVSRDDAHRVPGGGPRAAGVVRRGVHRDAARGGGPARGRRAGRDRGGDRVPGPADRPGGAHRAARRRTPGRGGAAVRGAGGHHLGQAPPAELRGVRRVPLLRAGRHAAGVPGADGRRGKRGGRDRDLRGPVAGRRARFGLPAVGGGPAGGAERLALRTGQGRRAAGPGGPAGPRGGRRAGLRQHDRRAGRAGLRRRLDPGERGRHAAGPRAAVRGGAGRRGPGPAARTGQGGARAGSRWTPRTAR